MHQYQFKVGVTLLNTDIVVLLLPIMLRFVLLAVLCCVGVIDCGTQSDHGVITVQNITEFLQKNPDATKLVGPCDNDEDNSSSSSSSDDDDDDLDNVFRYTLGCRQLEAGE